MRTCGTSLLLVLVGTLVIAAQQHSAFDVIPRDMEGDIEISSSDDKLMTIVTIDSNGQTRDGFVDYVFLIELRPGSEAPEMARTFGRLVRRDSSLELDFRDGKQWIFFRTPEVPIARPGRSRPTRSYPTASASVARCTRS